VPPRNGGLEVVVVGSFIESGCHCVTTEYSYVKSNLWCKYRAPTNYSSKQWEFIVHWLFYKAIGYNLQFHPMDPMIANASNPQWEVQIPGSIELTF
jgi:hypothetical protein